MQFRHKDEYITETVQLWFFSSCLSGDSPACRPNSKTRPPNLQSTWDRLLHLRVIVFRSIFSNVFRFSTSKLHPGSVTASCTPVVPARRPAQHVVFSNPSSADRDGVCPNAAAAAAAVSRTRSISTLEVRAGKTRDT